MRVHEYTPPPRPPLAHAPTTDKPFGYLLWLDLVCFVGVISSSSRRLARSLTRSPLSARVQVKWGQDKSGDSTKRSLAKAVLWRVFAASNTLICGVFLAKDLSVASKIAGTDTLFKTVSERVVFLLRRRGVLSLTRSTCPKSWLGGLGGRW